MDTDAFASKRLIRIELPTEFAVGSVNAYLFTEPEPVLVDTGVKTGASWNALTAALADHGLSVRDLSKVIITHPHVDHFGQAAEIVARSDATVFISELGESWLVDFPVMWERRIAYYRDHVMKAVGFSPAMIDVILNYMAEVVAVCDPVPAERIVSFSLGESLELGGARWQVLHMPGHSSHQTCFYQPETGQFISADMLLSKAPTPIVERPRDGGERVPSLPVFLDSLTVLESLKIGTVFPGHGQPFGHHREVIDRQRRRIQSRKGECLQLISDGYATIVDLVDIMYAHLPVQFRFAGLWMLIGYLDLLKAEKAIKETEVNGVWHYRASGE